VDTSDAEAATIPSGAELASGSRLGRYVVTGVLGSGGMGVVYAARDPELDRRVAIKLLRRGVWGDEAEGVAQSRMQREAQAMARLAHPNVIAVYDVGALEDQLFIAMEFVEGPTLDRWLQEEERGWREVIEVFSQAARGLAAAHAAGLVHRDFKPGNVIVGADGRVRVFDFGLARAASSRSVSQEHLPRIDPNAAHTNAPAPGWLTTPLTRPGAAMGTPEYMAPEQIRGKPADARSDQFSFCAALHEALYRERAFPGDSPSEVASAILLGVTRAPLDDRKAPAWIRAVVARGLQPDPRQRFPSMNALVRALSHDPRLAIRRGFLIALGAAITVAAALFFLNLESRISAAELARNAKPSPHFRQLTFAGDVQASALAPDGNALAYVTQHKVVLRDLKTDTERVGVVTLGASPRLRWSPDASTLLISAAASGDGTHALLLARAGGAALSVEHIAEVASWSPDGGRIASAAREGREIDITRRSTGEVRALPLGGAFSSLADIDWSPNSNRLAFLTRGVSQALWTIGAGGGGQRTVLEEPLPVFSLRWSPRADAIYYLRGGPVSQDLMKLPVDQLSGTPTGTPLLVLHDLQVGPDTTGISLSRDGHRLAYTRRRHRAVASGADEFESDVWLVDDFD